MQSINIAVFASGNGTNAEHIVRYFADSQCVRVALIVSSRQDAPVVERARRLGTDCVVLTSEQMRLADKVLQLLRSYGIRLIALAGYLKLVPQYLIDAYPKAILNLHPALLPRFGGKGMYGSHVHEAVIKSGERESGITIHYVNSHYDDGLIIGQWRCTVEPNDTAETLAQRIHSLEYSHYPEAIEREAQRIMLSCEE